MVHEEHSKIGAAGSQDRFVCLEINVIDSKAAVAEKTLFFLVVELLKDKSAVAGLRHLLVIRPAPDSVQSWKNDLSSAAIMYVDSYVLRWRGSQEQRLSSDPRMHAPATRAPDCNWLTASPRTSTCKSPPLEAKSSFFSGLGGERTKKNLVYRNIPKPQRPTTFEQGGKERIRNRRGPAASSHDHAHVGGLRLPEVPFPPTAQQQQEVT
ncbi:hypothetical protein ACRRTK_005454 [Alexandromys fortis]